MELIEGVIIFIGAHFFAGGFATFLYLFAYLLIGYKVILKAIKNIGRKDFLDENFLMCLATFGAIALGDYSEAIAVMLFYAIGEIFQGYAVNKTRSSISSLMDIKSEYATIVKDDQMIQVTPEEVQVGDTIVVKVGEKVPLDGKVIKGNSMLDTASLTGESVPRSVEVGDEVLSGVVNLNDVIYIEVTKPYADSTVSRIIDLVENSASKKAKIEKFITRFAKVYTPTVVGLAVLLLIVPMIILPNQNFYDWLYRACTFLVVSCPCALVISVPLGLYAGIGKASALGVLVKGGNYLELLKDIDTVVFDKTGTLTHAKPVVLDVVPLQDYTREEVLKIAACLEEHFPHSVANAIVHQAEVENLKHREEHAEVKYVIAHGISTSLNGEDVIIGSSHFVFEDEGVEMTQEIKDLISSLESKGSSSLIYLAIAKKLAGIISIYDPLKPEAKEVVQELRDIGFDKVIMLTGDSPNCAKAIAKQLNLDDFRAGVLPEDKASYIESLKKEGNTVVMVGDGINDTPALSMADVSISLQDSSDIARELADITLVSNSLNDIVALRMISEGLFKRIHSQYRLIVGLNTSFIVLGALGLLTPQMLAMLHNGSTFLIASGSTRSLLH